MKESQATPPRNARSTINASRRRTALIQGALLILLISGGWWLASRAFVELVLVSILAYAAASAAVKRREVCPTCGQGISTLPSEGHIQIPELSRAIRMCPYCGADYSYSRNVPSK